MPLPNKGPPLAAEAFVVENASPSLIATPGTGQSFRLDCPVVNPKVKPVVPSGRSMIPNKLAPPLVPLIKGQPDPVSPPKPVTAQQPKLDDFMQLLKASPQGSFTSYWQCVPIDQDNYRAKVLLLNPATGRYAGLVPPDTPLTNTSVVSDVIIDGSPVHAVDLKQYLMDMSAWIATAKSVDAKAIVARVTSQLENFTWTLQRADLGPDQG